MVYSSYNSNGTIEVHDKKQFFNLRQMFVHFFFIRKKDNVGFKFKTNWHKAKLSDRFISCTLRLEANDVVLRNKYKYFSSNNQQ